MPEVKGHRNSGDLSARFRFAEIRSRSARRERTVRLARVPSFFSPWPPLRKGTAREAGRQASRQQRAVGEPARDHSEGATRGASRDARCVAGLPGRCNRRSSTPRAAELITRRPPGRRNARIARSRFRSESAIGVGSARAHAVTRSIVRRTTGTPRERQDSRRRSALARSYSVKERPQRCSSIHVGVPYVSFCISNVAHEAFRRASKRSLSNHRRRDGNEPQIHGMVRVAPRDIKIIRCPRWREGERESDLPGRRSARARANFSRPPTFPAPVGRTHARNYIAPIQR